VADAAGGRYYPISGLSSEALYSIVEGEEKNLFERNA
jgi:Mg-chelatase subunit ChlD